MASIYQLKPAFQRLLQPLLQLCARLGITPNQVTILALLLSILGGITVWNASLHPYLLLSIPVILLVRMALNALDGMLARTYQQSTPLGEILNEVGDIISDTALYLPFIVIVQNSSQSVLLICLFVLLGTLSEFCGVLAKSMIGIRRYDGPMGKSDRAFVISLYALSLYFLPVWTQQNSSIVFAVLNSLLLLSCANRLKAILEKSK
jgi:CDP-diacylglycerol--glycerol-3-phosphate 3-phosphatidyltransferase